MSLPIDLLFYENYCKPYPTAGETSKLFKWSMAQVGFNMLQTTFSSQKNFCKSLCVKYGSVLGWLKKKEQKPQILHIILAKKSDKPGNITRLLSYPYI